MSPGRASRRHKTVGSLSRLICACPPAYAFVCAHLLTRRMLTDWLTDWHRSSLLNARSSACDVVSCFVVVPAMCSTYSTSIVVSCMYTHARVQARKHEHAFTFRHAPEISCTAIMMHPPCHAGFDALLPASMSHNGDL